MSLKVINVLGNIVNDYGGDKEPIIFLHSFPLNSLMWAKQVEYLKDKFRVITYDIRGLGLSKVNDYVYSMEKLVNDFFHIINKLKILKVNACGLSMGGYILLRAMLKDESRFKSVILVNTKAEKDTDEELLNRSNAIIKIKSGGRKEFLAKFKTKMVFSRKYDNEIFSIINNNSDEGICAALLAISTRINMLDNLEKINTPVLLISSDKDRITDYNESFKLHAKLKNSYIEVIKNAGHLCNIEKKEIFNKLIESFLKQNNY